MGAEGILVPGRLGTVEVTYGEVGEDLGRGSGREGRRRSRRAGVHDAGHGPFFLTYKYTDEWPMASRPGTYPRTSGHSRQGPGPIVRKGYYMPYHTIPYHTVPKKAIDCCATPARRPASRLARRAGARSLTYQAYLPHQPGSRPGHTQPIPGPILSHARASCYCPDPKGYSTSRRCCRIWQLCAWAERDDVPG